MSAKAEPSGPTPIVLLTDFGTDDWYVGVMKGVLSSCAAGVPLIDLTHGIGAGDIHSAAFVLENSWKWFPDGSVFLVVVDPGVGTSRRPLAVHAANRFFVGPDNGVLSPALTVDASTTRVIEPEALGIELLSHTFHGRDLFSPAAAYLATMQPFEGIGQRATDVKRLEPRHNRREPGPRQPVTSSMSIVLATAFTDVDGDSLKQFQGDQPASSLMIQSEGTVIQGGRRDLWRCPGGEGLRSDRLERTAGDSRPRWQRRRATRSRGRRQGGDPDRSSLTRKSHGAKAAVAQNQCHSR